MNYLFQSISNLPVTDPVVVFALVLFVIFLAPILLKYIRIPGIIGLILAGAILGPNGFHILERSTAIELFGTVGLLYIMFQAGLEIDLNEFKRNRKKALVFGLLSFTIPQVFGSIALWFILGQGWTSAILIASMFASHTLVAYSIVSRMELLKEESVTVTLGGTLVVNVLALLVLAVVASSVQGVLSASFWIKLLFSMAIFVYLVIWIGPKIVRWFFQNFQTTGASQYIFVLSFVFASSFGAKIAGLEAIIGAFLAGLAINRLVPKTSPLMNRIDFVGSTLFIPFFLIHVGMLSDLSILFRGTNALIAVGVITALSLFLKWLPAYITAKIFKYIAEEKQLIFGLSVAQAASTLAAALVGYDLGLIDDNVLNGIIIMILVTCLISALVVESAAKKIAVREGKKSKTDTAPEQDKILVPVANPDTLPRLIDLAVMIKKTSSEKPIYPLSVVQDNTQAQDRILELRQELDKAIKYAAASDTVLEPVIRIDWQIGEGIVRAIKELAINKVIIGWHDQSSSKGRLFGTVLDYILANCSREILVSRLLIPLNTIKKIFLIVPDNAQKEIGFKQWVHTLRVLANQTTGKLHIAGPDVVLQQVVDIANNEKPVVEIETKSFDDWDDVLSLSRELTKDTLFVTVLAREKTISYNRWMKSMPHYLTKHFQDVSFLLIYPNQQVHTERNARQNTWQN